MRKSRRNVTGEREKVKRRERRDSVEVANGESERRREGTCCCSLEREGNTSARRNGM